MGEGYNERAGEEVRASGSMCKAPLYILHPETATIIVGIVQVTWMMTILTGKLWQVRIKEEVKKEGRMRLTNSRYQGFDEFKPSIVHRRSHVL